MKILTNIRIKSLFLQISLTVLGFMILSWVLASKLTSSSNIELNKVVWYMPVCLLIVGIAVLVFCYRYFREQNRMIEDAVVQIRQFISGDLEARIECDEEGELFRLFHEVNSMAAVLNAKAYNEGKTRKFLQNTISDVSHQLKTPLAALNIYNGIIQAEAEAADLATVKEFTGLSDQELDRIETLVQNFLKIAKFDAGTMVLEKHPENVSEMMMAVKKQFLFRARQEGKEIIISGDEAISFYCDRNWIVEAVGNIVKNALDHTKEGDCIQVTWSQSASAIRIAVKDNGSGIHPEDLYHIFKRFYRSRYSKDTQGIGLGLPLAKFVAEAHNGTIEVGSRLGDGTTFVMNFLITTEL
ncbi:MAG: HAMP domain-containing histidine kinase [Lachnospiraceae bacterium]|nr:HAMP domain-containing histidine kinase [Lachnospiraceae bacterium]